MNRSLLVDGVQKESLAVPGKLRNAAGYLTALNPTSMWFMGLIVSGDYEKFPSGNASRLTIIELLPVGVVANKDNTICSIISS